MNAFLFTLANNPYVIPFLIVCAINLVVFTLTFLLFHKLRSQASVKGRRWTARGALAGFIILTGLELYLIDRFAPNSLEARPSYRAARGFYEDIQRHDYAGAWALLHPDYQRERWSSKMADFIDGYKNTERVTLLAIMLEGEESPVSHDYIVYYVDEVNSPVIPGLENLTKAKIRNWSTIGQNLNETRTLLEKAGLDVTVFDDVDLLRLLAPDRGNKIVWLIDTQGRPSASGRKAADLFPEKRSVEFITARRVTVEATATGWKVKNIRMGVVKDE